MSLNLNPWLALLLGILIGWLLEWLLELWFFRRRRLERQGRVAERSVNWTAVPVEPEAPRAEMHWPEVGNTVAEVSATLSEVQPLAAEIEAPSIGAELPAAVTAPAGAVSGGLPEAAVEVTKPPAGERSVNWTAAPVSPGRIWDGSQPDDFEPLGGIGEVYEGRLYDAGICTYADLAAATVEQLAEICKAPAWRMPDYAGWIAQAAVKLAEGK